MDTILFDAPTGWTQFDQEDSLLTLVRDGNYNVFRPNIVVQARRMLEDETLRTISSSLLADLPQDGSGPKCLVEQEVGNKELPALIRKATYQIKVNDQLLDITQALTLLQVEDTEQKIRGVYAITYCALAADFEVGMPEYQAFVTSVKFK